MGSTGHKHSIFQLIPPTRAHFICYTFFSFVLFTVFELNAAEPSPTNTKISKLVIIIDDLGNNEILSQRAARLNDKITLSILPFTPFGSAIAELGHGLGKEVMLHVPMSNTRAYPLGLGGLKSSMNESELINTLRQDLNSVPHVKGVNNHMGSKLTQEKTPMEWFAKELRSRGLYFVDSRTTDKTLALDIAKQTQVPALKRDVFLDDDQDPMLIRIQLDKAVQLAQQRGYAVAIGHPYPSTLDVIEKAINSRQFAQVRLARPSEILGELYPGSLPSQTLITTYVPTYCPALPYFAWPEPKRDATFSDILHRTLVDWLAID